MYIMHPDKTGGISILIPSGELPLDQVALKDVPANTPFIYITEADIPASREYRDAWEADFSSPDGYGIGAESWFKLQEISGGKNNN